MPISGGARQAAENRIDFVSFTWKPEGSELTTVGPTVYPAFAVHAGDLVIPIGMRVRTGFDGTSVAILVGDGDDADGYFDAGDITEATPALYAAKAAFVNAQVGKFYTADVTDAVDVSHTGAANATTGEADFFFLVIKTGSRATS